MGGKIPRRTFRCPDPEWEAVKLLAAERGETVTDVIRRALSEYSKPRMRWK